MPRISINVSAAQLDRLTCLNRALNERARKLDSEAQSCSVEATAVTALECGVQAMTRIWYQTEMPLRAVAEVAPGHTPVECDAHTVPPELQVWP